MSADFSRVRANPLAAFAGVELQQGRVLLDADFNEQVAIVDRRLRALASDVLGRATVSQTTPDAFRLTLVGGELAIGPGRMYVDGLPAENFGVAAPGPMPFDALLGEPRRAGTTTYATQPWLQPPPPLPAGGRHLVYLDVWEREVTHVEDPSLVEPALAVDSTSRRQVVWQVRVLAAEAPPGVDCATPDAGVPGWADLIAPSSGRLTTGTYDVPGLPDPCELPPGGGYTGLENQTYRVEIHDPGAPGAGATFKWSRDNASVASRVATIVSATDLELVSLGRDEVLRFAVGHWVEITDDARELSQRAGEMRRIAEIDDANRRIRFAPALPAEMLPAALPSSTHPQASNLRVRRWDQGGKVYRTAGGGSVAEVQDLDAPGSGGVIAVPAAGTTLLLENGVTVRFSVAGPKGLRAGDAWVFAARTADGSVEPLVDAAPRAVHHHYARLGFWDLGAGTVSDCRRPWPPVAGGHDCGCTACVTEEGHAGGAFTIQQAIERVRAAGGGTVCIGTGQYALAAPLDLGGARSVRLQGQGTATVLVAAGTAIAMRCALAVAVQDLAVVSLGLAPAIVVAGALGLVLERLAVAVVGQGEGGRGVAVALAGAVLAASVRDSWLLAPVGIGPGTAAAAATADVPSVLITAGLTIEDNVLWCRTSAVRLDGPAYHLLETRVAGNQVLGCSDAAIVLLGHAGPGSAARVERNLLHTAGSGVVAGVDGLWIGDNKLTGSGAAGSAGIELRTGRDRDGIDMAQILANQIRGYGHAGIVLRAPVRALVVKLNVVESCANGIVMLDDAEGASVAIENNVLRDLGAPANPNDASTVVGIGLSRIEGATVAGNQLQRVGAAAGNAPLRAALMALAVGRLRAHGNQVSENAPAGDFAGQAFGVYVAGPFVQLELQHNQIERDARPSATPSASGWAAIAAGAPAAGAAAPSGLAGVQRFGRFATVPFEGGATLVLAGGKGYVAAAAGGGAVAVLGNTIAGRGSGGAVRLAAGRECLFNDNRCTHVSTSGTPTIAIQAPVALVQGNRVQHNTDIAIAVDGAQTVAALGNVTTGIVQAPGLPPAFAALNLRA